MELKYVIFLNSYLETLGEVLIEIYEELNQPLPESLSVLVNNESLSDLDESRNPSSVKSYVSKCRYLSKK